MKISCVIIAKNESSCIAQCLESIKWIDQIIVCDTWSTDNTIEITRQYTDDIHHFEWCDDFSLARNYAKQFATNDWVLSLDCDEVLEEWWVQKLHDRINKLPYDADWVFINMWNWANANCNAIRLFKKDLDWKWKIHECISPRWSIESWWITIRYGRSDSHNTDPDLDLRIMQKVSEEEPFNTRNLFYLAREYYYYGKYSESEEIYLKYISLNSTHFNEVTDAYYMLAKIYWENGKWEWEKSREMLMKVIMRNVNFRSAYILMAQQMIDPLKKITWLKFAEIADNSNCLFIH